MFRGLGTDYTGAITSTANQLGVPPSLALALAQKESSLNPNAVSSAGAQGLFQLMPGTAASLGVSNPFDPQQNITGGLTYLKQLYNQYGNWNDALIAYNEGPGTFSSGTIYSSSQSYADSILASAGVSDPSSPSDFAFSDPTSASGGWGVSLDSLSIGGFSGAAVLAGIVVLGTLLVAVSRR